MRRSGKWVLTLGLVATLPTVASAGPFSFLRGGRDKEEAKITQNQQVAENIAKALRAAKLSGRDVEIEFQNGIAVLTGVIQDAGQKAKATQAASHVPGVESVDNRMRIASIAPAVPESQARSTPPKPKASQPRSMPRQEILPAAARQESQPSESADATNQETAQQIGAALSAQKLTGYDIEIRYQNGVASLGGTVSTPEQRQAAARAAASVPGVKRVANRLQVVPQGQAAAQPTPRQPMPGRTGPGQTPPQQMTPQQMMAVQRMMAARHMAARQQQAGRGQGVPVVPAGFQPPGPGGPAGPGGPMGPPPGGPVPPAPPEYGHGGGASFAAYNAPHVPPHAWPSYAAYPNYAQVTYPEQYSASAWPYIGPFYPYPQVPLGWRKASLEWDDGYWNLSFNPRTDKWFWFLNPKHWGETF